MVIVWMMPLSYRAVAQLCELVVSLVDLVLIEAEGW